MAPKFIPDAWRMEARSWPYADVSFLMDHAGGSLPRHLRTYAEGYDELKYRTTVRDLASLSVSLSSQSFEGIGSLYPSTTAPDSEPLQVQVGPLLSFEPQLRSSPPLGPFKTNREAKTAKIDWLLHLIEKHRLGWLPPSGRHPNPQPVLWYLTLLEVRVLVQGCEEMGRSGPTYLRHGDQNIGCILTHEDGSLAGMVDWEFAYTCPLEEAFATPTFLLGGFRDWGSNDLGNQDIFIKEFESLGRHDLASAVRGCMKYNRLSELLWDGCKSPMTLDGLLGMEEAFMGTLDNPPTTLEEWETRARHRHRDNEKLKKVEEDWKNHLAELEATKVAEELKGAKAVAEPEATTTAEGSPATGTSSIPGGH
ncbi:uncharacterized protein LOC62_01G000112 [Vanrija pseudolonga]|uniref:Aminoglycoside phosphotransferase domain-containing protein n=1 Tax=Vanrija pseudolonga TaxID=143232 RepID=A0AAF0XYX9_9TREE|nr:hypothetical protein LOC62_01G000112 [Vanrija pseudolonga]